MARSKPRPGKHAEPARRKNNDDHKQEPGNAANDVEQTAQGEEKPSTEESRAAETLATGGSSSSTAPGRSLLQAVLTAAGLIAILVLSYALGELAMFILLSVVVLMALFELLHALVRKQRYPSISFGVACGLAVLLVAYTERAALFAVVGPATLLGAFLVALSPSRVKTGATDAAWTVLGVAWIGGGGAGAVSILMLNPGGLSLLVAFILITALGDIGAYLVGSRFGRHKMAPSVSPGKSWEGFAGGLAGTLIGAAAFGGALDEISVVHGLGVGLICGVLGPIGDLVASLVKREIGIKDSGHLLPGHGGFLDRIDGMILCAPAVFLYLRFIAL